MQLLGSENEGTLRDLVNTEMESVVDQDGDIKMSEPRPTQAGSIPSLGQELQSLKKSLKEQHSKLKAKAEVRSAALGIIVCSTILKQSHDLTYCERNLWSAHLFSYRAQTDNAIICNVLLGCSVTRHQFQKKRSKCSHMQGSLSASLLYIKQLIHYQKRHQQDSRNQYKHSQHHLLIIILIWHSRLQIRWWKMNPHSLVQHQQHHFPSMVSCQDLEWGRGHGFGT